MARERDDDDYDDDRSRRNSGGVSPGGMDGFLGNMIVTIIFAVLSFCCPCLGLILGGIGMATCKTPEGKRGATILLVAAAAGIVVNLILKFVLKIDPANMGN